MDVPKLEFVPVPEEAVEPCIVPLPPLDENGVLPYEALPSYTVQILAVLEECNERINTIKGLQPEINYNSSQFYRIDPVMPTQDWEDRNMQVQVQVFDNVELMRQEFNRITNNEYSQTASQLLAVSFAWTFEGPPEVGPIRLCKILVVRPDNYSSAEWGSWGHELGHCVWGSWHKVEDWK